MKRTTIFFSILFSFTLVIAETNEPCKGVLIPAEMKSSELIFEIPTYDEYVRDVVIESLMSRSTVAENNILNENTFKKITDAQIKAIRTTYTGNFKIMSRKEAKSASSGTAFIFQQEYISPLVISENNWKFEHYTAFSIQQVNSSKKYTLVDPSNSASATCLVKKGQYKFNELISIIQK